MERRGVRLLLRRLHFICFFMLPTMNPFPFACSLYKRRGPFTTTLDCVHKKKIQAAVMRSFAFSTRWENGLTPVLLAEIYRKTFPLPVELICERTWVSPSLRHQNKNLSNDLLLPTFLLAPFWQYLAFAPLTQSHKIGYC